MLWLFSLISSFIVGAIILALAPVFSLAVTDRIRTSPWWSMLTGFIIFVVVPVAATILLFTIIGIPLALILFAIYFIAVYISLIFSALTLGRWIFGRSGRPRTSAYLDLLVGMVVLWILMAIPFFGWLIKLAAIFLGLGAFSSLRYQEMRAERAARTQ
jgi:hypothetical protein